MKFSKRFTEIIRFGINGGISFVADYGILYFLTEIFLFHYLISSAISFTVSVIINYYICLLWVFEGAAKQSIKSKVYFVGSSVIGLLLTLFLMWLCVEIIGVHYLLSKIAVTLIVMMWNYVVKRKSIYMDG